MTGSSLELFITGGTGYIGRRSIPALIDRGHRVRALVRKGSESKLPGACSALLPIVADAFDPGSHADSMAPASTVVHLTRTFGVS